MSDEDAATVLAGIAEVEDLNGRIRGNILDTQRDLPDAEEPQGRQETESGLTAVSACRCGRLGAACSWTASGIACQARISSSRPSRCSTTAVQLSTQSPQLA